MALLLGELVELEQGEGLFDVESGLGLVHCLPIFSRVEIYLTNGGMT